jgi:hypothetical protein
MNKSLAFTGREKEIERLRALYAERKHVVIVGPAGIGKTALLRQIQQHCPMLLCEETSSLRRICDGLERQLGWKHYKMNVIERKNRLLAYLERRGEPVALDHVALTPPRVSRFIGHLAERLPVWIGCRSMLSEEVGHVWQYLYQFERIEVSPLAQSEVRILIEEAVTLGKIQPEAHERVAQIYRLCKGTPRILEELLIELAAREYKMGSSFGIGLLDLDRRIQEISSSIQAQNSSG